VFSLLTGKADRGRIEEDGKLNLQESLVQGANKSMLLVSFSPILM
jgi:hypothetical protein